MVNSSKTPTGRAKKGLVTIRPDAGCVKACFPRANFPGESSQVKKSVGVPLVDGWEGKVTQLQTKLQLELDEGKLATSGGKFNLKRFNEILVEYKLRPDLKIVESITTSDGQLPPKPQLSLMEVWDMYCEYRKPGLRESVYQSTYQSTYKNFLNSAIKATKSEDALKIRNWLVENRSHGNVKLLLSSLSKAYRLGMKNKLLTHNPFEGMAEEMVNRGAEGKKQDEIETENDDDLLDRTKAYTWEESQAILDYIKNRKQLLHRYGFVKFKFLTGCRTGEAIAFMWCDVEWDKERILIRRTYDDRTKKFYPLKNDKTYKGEETRKFPMPKDGELWGLLKSIPQGSSNEVVFKSKTGKIIDRHQFADIWRGRGGDTPLKGIIPRLIEQGRLTRYIKPYNTRHTFITHAVFDLGIDGKIVSKWCGHTLEVSNKHYQDVAIFAGRTNPEIPQQQSELDLLKEQLRQQQEEMEEMKKLLQDRDK